MTDSTTRPPRTHSLAALIERFEQVARFPSYRLMADDIEEIVASLRAIEAEAAAPDAGLREKVADLLELLPVPQDDREYARAVEEVYVALAAHRSSDPSPATPPKFWGPEEEWDGAAPPDDGEPRSLGDARVKHRAAPTTCPECGVPEGRHLARCTVGKECPMCGGVGRIFNITEAVNDAIEAGAVTLAPAGPAVDLKDAGDCGGTYHYALCQSCGAYFGAGPAVADTWRDTGNRGAAEHAARSGYKVGSDDPE